MAAADVPLWIQQVGAVAGTALVAAAVAWNERRKGKAAGEREEGATVLAGAVLAGPSVERLATAAEAIVRAITTLGDQQHTDSRREVSAMENLTDELRRNTEASGKGAVTPRDMMRLIQQMKDER